MKKRYLIPVLVGLVSVGLVSAGLSLLVSPAKGEERSRADADKIVVGVSFFNVDNFFKTVGQGMEAAAAEEGIEILFNSANIDETEQDKILEEYVAQQVDAILLSPVDGSKMPNSLKTAFEKGIQIICFNVCFEDEIFQELQISASYGTNPAHFGAETAKIVSDWMMRQALEKLYVGWVGCDEGCKTRVQGFFKTLDDLHVYWELVDGQCGFNEASEAIGVVEALIQKHPEIHIVFAENEGTTIGAVQAIKRQGLAGKVFVFGINISPQIAEMLLADDNILQTVTAQSPYQMGYMAVKAVAGLVKGGARQDPVHVPIKLFRRDQPKKQHEYLAQFSGVVYAK